MSDKSDSIFKGEADGSAGNNELPTGQTHADIEKTGKTETAQPHAQAKPQPDTAASEPTDPNVVFWEGPDDPANPINWQSWVKITNIGIVSALTFITPLASSMFAPGVPETMREFNSSNEELADFVVSVYVLGFAFGPMVMAPMSELYGRLYIYHICNIGFIIFSVACALSTNIGMLTAFRFFQGTFGAAPVTNGGGTIADLIVPEKRGAVIALYAIAPILGPVIGPVAGGFLVAAKGWRWVFWVLAIVHAGFTVLSAAFLRETYPATLLERKAARLRRSTGNTALRSKLTRNLAPRQLFLQAIVRPSKMIVFSPIILALSLYTGVVYGYQYLMFSTYTVVFQKQYHFSTAIVGLTFLGFGVGSLLGLFIVGALSDRILKSRTQVSPSNPSGTRKPEFRLPPLQYGAIFIPAGLFMYGWSAQAQVHWMVPIIGTALIGFGTLAVFLCITAYLVDAFTIYAASALAANTVVRSVMGAILPLAGQRMYQVLGLGWGNSLLGFIALALVPVPFVLVRYGQRLREAFDVSRL